MDSTLLFRNVCPMCGKSFLGYDYSPYPTRIELRNAAKLNLMLKAAEKAFWPTYLDIMRGMDDDELIACIQELAKEEYVRGFLGMPSMIGNLPERLKERSGKNDNTRQSIQSNENTV